ncbi:unnamed protein product, partial [Brassica rapa subsp. trilocularis]
MAMAMATSLGYLDFGFNLWAKQSSKDLLSDCLSNGVCWKEKKKTDKHIDPVIASGIQRYATLSNSGLKKRIHQIWISTFSLPDITNLNNTITISYSLTVLICLHMAFREYGCELQSVLKNIGGWELQSVSRGVNKVAFMIARSVTM